jgi:CsoR family transcriptional regulator, copper-sensing transcriptional repressor
MQGEPDGIKLSSRRASGEKTSVLQRLARIEGQVRGLRLMVEQDREAAEQIQQLNAVLAALREVALLSISQEIKARITDMAGEAPSGDVQGVIELLRATFRLS